MLNVVLKYSPQLSIVKVYLSICFQMQSYVFLHILTSNIGVTNVAICKNYQVISCLDGTFKI